jgi:hypothetical protein
MYLCSHPNMTLQKLFCQPGCMSVCMQTSMNTYTQTADKMPRLRVAWNAACLPFFSFIFFVPGPMLSGDATVRTVKRWSSESSVDSRLFGTAVGKKGEKNQGQ